MAIPEEPPISSTAISSDPTLTPFLSSTFSPVQHLNSTLPPWSSSLPAAPSTSLSSSSSNPRPTTNLSTLTTTSQTQLSQLQTQLTRLTTQLTQLTDDILRSGGRLEYEVDVLRSDSTSLEELLSQGLKDEIDIIAPTLSKARDEQDVGDVHMEEKDREQAEEMAEGLQDQPEYIKKLHTLTLVRSRLQTVMKTFDAAMLWPLAPSETSITNSLISVSAPSHSASSSGGREEKSLDQRGKEWSEKTREEIRVLLSDSVDSRSGVEEAERKVRELRELCGVFRGTGEEKGRVRFVESLGKTVDEFKERKGMM